MGKFGNLHSASYGIKDTCASIATAKCKHTRYLYPCPCHVASYAETVLPITTLVAAHIQSLAQPYGPQAGSGARKKCMVGTWSCYCSRSSCHLNNLKDPAHPTIWTPYTEVGTLYSRHKNSPRITFTPQSPSQLAKENSYDTKKQDIHIIFAYYPPLRRSFVKRSDHKCRNSYVIGVGPVPPSITTTAAHA